MSVVGGVLYGDACQRRLAATLFMYGQTVGPILKQDNVCDSCSAETLEISVGFMKVNPNPRVSFQKNEQDLLPTVTGFSHAPMCDDQKKPDLLCLQHGFGSFLGFLVLPEFGREEQATQAGVEIESYMEAT